MEELLSSFEDINVKKEIDDKEYVKYAKFSLEAIKETMGQHRANRYEYDNSYRNRSLTQGNTIDKLDSERLAESKLIQS